MIKYNFAYGELSRHPGHQNSPIYYIFDPLQFRCWFSSLWRKMHVKRDFILRLRLPGRDFCKRKTPTPQELVTRILPVCNPFWRTGNQHQNWSVPKLKFSCFGLSQWKNRPKSKMACAHVATSRYIQIEVEIMIHWIINVAAGTLSFHEPAPKLNLAHD